MGQMGPGQEDGNQGDQDFPGQGAKKGSSCGFRTYLHPVPWGVGWDGEVGTMLEGALENRIRTGQ